MTVKNEQNETIILTPEQEAIKRLEDKLKESEETIHKFESVIDFLKPFLHRKIIQDFYDLKSEYLSLKSYATTVVDLFKKK
jgi:hypothetical protein